MKTYIKYWLMAVTTVMVCTNHVRAQEFYRENETAMHIFHELDRMFPKRYLEQRWMTGAQFWVQYWFEDHEDYEEHRPKITEIFDLLDATPFLHKHTEETDSGDIMRKTYAMSLRSDIQGQQDFLKLEASPTGVFFYYQTTNRFAQAENDAIPDQAIIAELEKLFNQYVSRRKTVKQEVHFHGAYGRVVHNKGYNNDPTAFSRAAGTSSLNAPGQITNCFMTSSTNTSKKMSSTWQATMCTGNTKKPG